MNEQTDKKAETDPQTQKTDGRRGGGLGGGAKCVKTTGGPRRAAAGRTRQRDGRRGTGSLSPAGPRLCAVTGGGRKRGEHSADLLSHYAAHPEPRCMTTMLQLKKNLTVQVFKSERVELLPKEHP